MSKEEKLKKLRQKIRECTNCHMCKHCTAPVPGIGSADAQVMVVGEAPGADEDKLGKPFVGKCGVILKEELKKHGYNKDNTYITNVLRCRPKKNRFPQDKDLVLNCRKWLVEEIKLIEPKAILTLGNQPLLYLLGETGITKKRGILKEKNGKQVFPTYHPSYVMRKNNMGDKETVENFQKDIKTFAEKFIEG